MFRYCAVVLCVALGCGWGELMNEDVDFLLDNMNALFDAEDTREINLENKAVNVGLLHCKGVRIGDLGTLVRTGNVTVTDPNPSVTIRGSLGLENLYLYFTNCQLNIRGHRILENPLNLTVAESSITAQVTLSPDEKLGCVGQVDNLVVDKFTGVKVHTGKGFIHVLEDSLLTRVAEIFEHFALEKLVDKVWDAADRAVEGGKVCSRSKFPRINGDPDVP